MYRKIREIALTAAAPDATDFVAISGDTGTRKLVLDAYVTSRLGAVTVPWGQVTGTPSSISGYGITDGVTTSQLDAAVSSLAPLNHTHPISEVAELQPALDGRALLVHSHAIADVTGLQGVLDGKAASSHGHAIADVTGLQGVLDGKAPSVHGHAIADVTGLQGALDGKAQLTGNDLVLPGKLVVQNTTDGGNTKGIWLWNASDSAWGIYLGQSGVEKSLSGGTAVAGADFTGHGLRFRVSNNTTNGFIWENAGETRLMSLNAGTGNLNVTGNITFGGTDLLATLNGKAPLTGAGTSGTWPISITGSAGSAGSVAWTNVSGRPTALSGFTNDYTGLPNNGNADMNFRAIRNSNTSAANDGMFIGYGNTNSGRTRIYSDGSTGAYYYSDASGNLFKSDGTAYVRNAGSWDINVNGYSYHMVGTGTDNNWNQCFSDTPAHRMSFREMSANGPLGTWWFVQNFRHSNGSNLWGRQLAWGWEDNADALWTRNVSSGSWGGWVKFLNTRDTGVYTSANRPGPIRLYRRDSDFNYSVQTWWTGSRWRLEGYNGDSFHAGCEVSYCDTAGVANALADGITVGSIYASNWFRSTGQTGWYNQTYGVGIRATQAGWVTTDGNARIWTYGLSSHHGPERNPSGTWAGIINMGTDASGYHGLCCSSRWGGNGSKVFEAASWWTGGSEAYTPILTVYGDRTVTVTGELRCTGNIIAYYSDERLKRIEGLIPEALAKVRSLSGFFFRGNEKAAELGYDTEKRQVGVSAQAVEAILPELIQPAPVSADYKTLDYAKLVPLLIEAIKELDARTAHVQR